MSNAEKSSSPSAENASLLAGRNRFERLLVNFIAKHTPKCREVVKLLSQSMEVKLPVTTRIRIGFHYLICIWCYRYGKQLRALRKITSLLPEHVDDCSQEALPYSSKERIKQVLRETQDD
jgi:hypothetical protein